MQVLFKIAVPLTVATLAFAASGCSTCIDGTTSINGACVADDAGSTDAGIADTGRHPDAAEVAGDDAQIDAGTPIDSGLIPDSGGTPTDGGMTGAEVTLGVPGRILLLGSAVLPMTADGAMFAPGEVYVAGDRIECVGALGACAGVSDGATVVDTGAMILPGLINAHTHTAFDWLQEWTPGRLWDDHFHWQRSSEYDAFISVQADNKTDAASLCAMVQWGEIRSLVNGTTTMFGTPQPRRCFRWLVRNAELSTGYNGWDDDGMRSNTLGIGTVDRATADDLIQEMGAGETTAYMIHLAEGISERAHDEFVELVQLDLLRPQTVIIHGTALTETDFDTVAAAGAKLVWSPTSNLALYGDTTNVFAATNAGVTVSIAPDWTPSGADDLLHELRAARDVVNERWPGLFDDRRLLEMITRIPAEQMAVANDVGSLEPGKYADILVLNADPTSPYNAVIESGPADIRMVMIGGLPTYGDGPILTVMNETPGACQAVESCGEAKVACWGDTPEGGVLLDAISDTITSFHPPGPQALIDCGR